MKLVSLEEAQLTAVEMMVKENWENFMIIKAVDAEHFMAMRQKDFWRIGLPKGFTSYQSIHMKIENHKSK